ncbi:MAG: hypothetical protein UCI88_00945 [Megasphaera massiliensis]|jgi:ABC-type transporter Mla subunit MlaD|uniref:hypothetical protein n=1 Tax=Megasphaera massiliensis TaxID=1232428 RepID=UPI002A74DA26|nr:hypothetical protein [Megasphaera massiliensis]MDY2965035.1 hypothetical protein [Megasphaera massiliensis]MEE0657657.1 hypothetical protein [Megasphaera massiliensis]
MANGLEAEFIKTIADVTKEVTDDVVRHSALASVNELNGTLKTLKAESGELVKDIRQAKDMYQSVSTHSQQSLQNFNQHVDSWLDNWLEKQNQLLHKIDERNRKMLSQIEQLERNQNQVGTALKQRIGDVERIQLDQKNAENKRALTRSQNFQATQKQIQETKETLQSNLISQTEFLQTMIKKLSYMMFFNLMIMIGIVLYMVRGIFL